MATNTPSKRKADIVADSITSTGEVTGSNLNISNWDIAHGWGNHASAGYITSIPSEYLTQTEGDSRYYTKTVSDLRYAQITGDTFTGNVTAPTFTGSLRGALTGAPDATIWCVSGQYDDWGIFYDEGNPDKIQYRSGGTTTATIALDTGAGYFNGGLTTGTNGDIATGVGGDLVAYGHVTASYGYVSASSGASGGFRIGGTRKDLNWDTAYGWGNHSDANYIVGGGTWTGGTGSSYTTLAQSIFASGNTKFTFYGSGGKMDVITDGEFYASEGASRVFHDTYHPNADKWTTARTLSLTGDVTGSVSWDGSANASITATVANDSHTHDGRYYTETESDSRFVNVTGDTMTGTLTVPNLTIGSGNKIKFANNDYIRYDDVANRFHFDSDGGTSNASVQASTFVGALSGNASTASKWATARSHTVTLTGDVTGSTTQSVDGTGNRTWSIATTVRQPAVGNWFNNGHPLVGTDGVMEIGKYIDFHNSSSTTSDYTARITNTGNHLYASGRWYVNSNQRVFADDYHPNADKWTSARTLTLSGDLTGSVSIDGSSNVTLSAQVSNDSHNHDHSDGDFSVGSNITANRYFQRASGIPTNNLGSPTVTEMALFDSQFNNKTEFFPPSALRFYQTTDGTNWTEITTYSDDQKKRFLHGDANSSVVIPNQVQGFRVEVDAQSYVFLNALYMYWSSQSHNTTVHVYRQRNSDSAWLTTASSSTTVSSWPGHLYLPFNTITFNPTNSSQHGKVRIEFTPNWSTGSYADRNINLYSMQLWGGYPAGRRNVYYTDQDHNVDFPSEVKGTSFNADSLFKVNGTTVIDASRNLTSIGNIGSSGTVTANGFNVSTLGGVTQAQGEFGIGSGNVGIHFNNSGDNLLPFNHGTLSFSNGVIDFGHESYRYKDGFFSGKISVSALEVYGNSIKFANLNDSITFEDTGNVYSFNTDAGTGNAPVRAGSYQVGTTTVIDSSRNATFANITHTGAQYWNGHIYWGASKNIYIQSGECSFDVSTSAQWRVWDATNSIDAIKVTGGSQVEIGQAGTRGLKVFGATNSTTGYQVNGTTVIDSGRSAAFNSVTATKFVASGSDTSPAGTTFSNTFKGVGTYRTAYFDGDGSNVSTWYGVGNTPFSAIDSTNGNMEFWVNHTNGSWYRKAKYNVDGLFLYSNLYFDDYNTRITQGDGNSIRAQTNYGYIDIAPQNSGYCHFQTDRSNFYFNKRITVDEGVIQSYNEDLILRRAQSSSHQMTLNTSGATFTGNVTAYSDVNLKDNITNIDNALDKVNSIRGVTYDRIDQDNARHAGVIAQEVEAVLPEVVHTDDDGIKSVAYGNMVGLLIEAIKEQQVQINELKSKLEK